jgi:hypothetical protein
MFLAIVYVDISSRISWAKEMLKLFNDFSIKISDFFKGSKRLLADCSGNYPH